MVHKFRMVRNSKPAPTSKMRVRAVCTMIQDILGAVMGVCVPAPCMAQSGLRIGVRELLSAGASPNKIPIAMEMISVNSRTVAFKPMSSLRGRVP